MVSNGNDGLREYLDEDPRARPLPDWIWGLSRWGKPVLVRAALAIAEACVDRWHQGFPREASWQRLFASSRLPDEALAALRAWLERGAPPGDAGLESHAQALRELMDRAAFHDYEISGGGLERERAVLAGRAIRMALEAAMWTEEHAAEGIPDEAERQARVGAGPAPEVWEAVRAYRGALPGTSEAAAWALIRDALRSR